jgi:hypothetical protein
VPCRQRGGGRHQRPRLPCRGACLSRMRMLETLFSYKSACADPFGFRT